MEVAKSASREVCAVCWGVCGFASSRENLEMAKSQEGLTSFCQARDLLAASAQCEMCDYLFSHAKEDASRFDLDARIAINIQFVKFGGEESFKGLVDNLRIFLKVEGKDSHFFAVSDRSEELGFITWSVLAHRGSYPARNHDLASTDVVFDIQMILRQQRLNVLQSITTSALAPSKRNYGLKNASSFTSTVPNPLFLYYQQEF